MRPPLGARSNIWNATGASTSPMPSATSAQRSFGQARGASAAASASRSTSTPGMTKNQGKSLKLGSAATAR